MKRTQTSIVVWARFAAVAGVIMITACGSDQPTVPRTTSHAMTVLGKGTVSERFTGEIWVRGNVAYTTTWGNRGAIGNAIKIWDVSGNVPALVDSVIVPAASTLGDIQAS